MFALISPVCTNPIGQYYLLYHSFGKKSMYKLHKILQRFLCRIPIDSKQGAPGPPARLCATIHVYLYLSTPTPIPWYPMPTTYIHTCIDTFIYLSYCLCLCLSYCLYLSYSSLLSCSVFSRSLLAPWQGLPLGRGSRPHLYCVCKYFILFNYYPVAYMYSMYLHVLYTVRVYIIYCACIQQMYVCMYVHSVV